MYPKGIQSQRGGAPSLASVDLSSTNLECLSSLDEWLGQDLQHLQREFRSVQRGEGSSRRNQEIFSRTAIAIARSRLTGFDTEYLARDWNACHVDWIESVSADEQTRISTEASPTRDRVFRRGAISFNWAIDPARRSRGNDSQLSIAVIHISRFCSSNRHFPAPSALRQRWDLSVQSLIPTKGLLAGDVEEERKRSIPSCPIY